MEFPSTNFGLDSFALDCIMLYGFYCYYYLLKNPVISSKAKKNWIEIMRRYPLALRMVLPEDFILTSFFTFFTDSCWPGNVEKHVDLFQFR